MCIFYDKINLVTFLILILAAFNVSSIKSNYYESIIEKVNSAGAKWKAGHNFDPSTPLSHLKRLMGVKKYAGALPLREEHHFPNDLKLPEEFDARKEWPHCPTIGQVRDQGNCGSCWAVSAAAVLSDRFCIATKGKFTLPLSVEELLSCCEHCGTGCKGGFPLSAWKYIYKFGLVTGGEYNSGIGCQPYIVENCDHHVDGGLPSCQNLPLIKTPKCREKCTNPSYNISFESDHHKIERVHVIIKDAVQIQREIFLNGPVEAAVTVFSDFPMYKSGVYHYVTGHKIGGHAVKILGWGIEDNTSYWLAANTWNTHWGDKGFFKILRGSNHCNIEKEIVAGIPLVN